MKHPKFRVRNVLDLDKPVIDELEQLGMEICECFPVKPQDVEIVGSYANGCASLYSDLDIALPMRDWNEQIELRRLYYGADTRVNVAVHNLTTAFLTKYNLRLDVNPVIPDNKLSKQYATYSLFERKLYGEPANLNLMWLKMSPYTQTYNLTKYDVAGTPVMSFLETKMAQTPAKWASDEFASEVAEWQKIYGDKFITCKLINGEWVEG